MQKEWRRKLLWGHKWPFGHSIQYGFHLPNQRGSYTTVVGLVSYGGELPAVFKVEGEITFGEEVESCDPIWLFGIRQINGSHVKGGALTFIWRRGGIFFDFVSRNGICGCVPGSLRRRSG